MQRKTGFNSTEAIQNRIAEGRTVTGGNYKSRSEKTVQHNGVIRNMRGEITKHTYGIAKF